MKKPLAYSHKLGTRMVGVPDKLASAVYLHSRTSVMPCNHQVI